MSMFHPSFEHIYIPTWKMQLLKSTLTVMGVEVVDPSEQEHDYGSLSCSIDQDGGSLDSDA